MIHWPKTLMRKWGHHLFYWWYMPLINKIVLAFWQKINYQQNYFGSSVYIKEKDYARQKWWLLGWSNAYIWSQWSSEPFTHYCKLSRFIANKTFLLCTIDKFWLYPKFLVIAFWPCRHWGRKNLEWWILIFWYLDQIRVPSPSPLHFLYISGAFVALVVLSLTVTKFLFISIFFSISYSFSNHLHWAIELHVQFIF